MQPKLFDITRPRQKPRVLMHVIDAGPDCGDDGATFDLVRLACAKCEHETDWEKHRRSEAKYGVPCPKCNTEDSRR